VICPGQETPIAKTAGIRIHAVSDKDRLEFLSEPDPDEPYAHIMRQAAAVIDAKTEGAKVNHRGTIATLVTSPDDRVELDQLISRIARNLGSEEIVHIDVGQIASALEHKIGLEKLGIPLRDIERQTLEENFYQYVFQGFGPKGEGYRISEASHVDRLQRSLEHFKLSSDVRQFVSTLEVDLPEPEWSPRLVVLHFPEMDEFETKDWKMENLPQDKARLARRNMYLYATIQRAGGRIFNNNPQGHSVVSVVDNAYTWFAARNTDFASTFEHLSAGIVTPGVPEIDRRRMNSL
jgi:hypothetical protein